MAYMNAFTQQPPPQIKSAIKDKLKDKQETTPAKCSTYATSSNSPDKSPSPIQQKADPKFQEREDIL